MKTTVGEFARRTGLTVVFTPSSEAIEVTGVFAVGNAGDRLDGATGQRWESTDVPILDWSPAVAAQCRQPLELVFARIHHKYAVSTIAVAAPQGEAQPPRSVLKAAEERGVAVLWSSTLSADQAIAAAQNAPATPRPTARDLDVAIAEVLAGDTNLRSVAEGLGRLLEAELGVYESSSLRVTTGGYRDDATDIVADLRLAHAGHLIGHVSVQRANPLTAEERTILDTFTGVLVLAMRTESAERTQRRPSQAQLSLMLGDDLQARESALRKSRRLRLFPPRRMIIAVLEPFADRVGSAGLSRLADQLEHPLRLSDQRAVVIVHEGTLVLLLDARTDVDAALRNFRRVTALPLTIGLSREFDDMRRAAGAHREARRAATIGKRMGAAGKLTRYDQLGLLRLLYQLPEHERHAYVSEVLGSAGEHNPEAADERRVLRALADAHWNVTEAASALFVHRNTLRAKLSKLEDKIGSFFNDSNSRLAVQIALELHRLDEPP